jgi:signal transduction histidine kinase
MIPLLTAGSFLMFNQFSKEINNRVDRELVYEEVQWIQYLEAVTANGSSFILRAPDLLIYPVDKPFTQYPQISNTYGTKARENVQIPFRQLSHVVPVNGRTYQIIIRKSQEQKAVLVVNITRIMLLVFAGLFIVTLFVNGIISKKLWKPFRQSLQKIRSAELQKIKALHFENTNIVEFNELNASLNLMTEKIHNDYVNMKEFTENAAHEMQTPLAVAQSKIELLLQDSNLNEEQVTSIMQASTALNRLSKLNQSLLLLAKIENQQYNTDDVLSLTDVTNKYLTLFEEIIKDKQITVEKNFQENLLVNLHPLLADSLISNLLGNAIKYNYLGGSITIFINTNTFHISNTSHLPAIDANQLFKRFSTTVKNTETSTGLGLAIVKRIVDTHHLHIEYYAENNIHHFRISK